jgi:hypothetical protein
MRVTRREDAFPEGLGIRNHSATPPGDSGGGKEKNRGAYARPNLAKNTQRERGGFLTSTPSPLE